MYQLNSSRSGVVVIANGGTDSTFFDARGYSAFGLEMPAAFTGTSITFKVSSDNSTFRVLTANTGAAITLNVATGKSYALPAQLSAWRYFKIVSSNAEAAERTLTVTASAATASDTSATSVVIDAITPGSGATSLGKAEDAAFLNADVGVMALGVRNDAQAALSGTDLDYTPIATDSAGRILINPGTGAANLGKAEDAVHASGDVGVMMLGVRNDDSATGISGTTGDYSPISVDNAGRVFVNVIKGVSGTDGFSNTIGYFYDGLGGTTGRISGQATHAFNGSTWDRWRNNVSQVVIASAARTATNSSVDLVNYNGVGIWVGIDVTAIVSTPSITVSIQNKLGTSYQNVLTSAAIVGTGQTYLRVYPGIAVSANVTASDVLSRDWRITVTHGNANSITYSVTAVILP